MILWIFNRTDTKFVSGCGLQTVKNQMEEFQKRLENLTQKTSGSYLRRSLSLPQKKSTKTPVAPAPAPHTPIPKTKQTYCGIYWHPKNCSNHCRTDNKSLLQRASSSRSSTRKLPENIEERQQICKRENSLGVRITKLSSQDW